MNYAEALSYWYLRLNGFFPLGNFVLHDYNAHLHTADCDMLAVRMPKVEETVGGQPVDWDNDSFNAWRINAAEQIVGAIVEVKGGDNAENPGDAFNEERLKIALYRLGFFSGQVRDDVLAELIRGPVVVRDQFAVVKLYITANPRQNREARPWYQISLTHVDAFVRNRFSRYRSQKNRARSFFPSELVQYLIWQSEEEKSGRLVGPPRQG